MIKRNINSEFVKFIEEKIQSAKQSQPNKKIDSIPELEEKIIANKDNDVISDNGWALIASVNGV